MRWTRRFVGISFVAIASAIAGCSFFVDTSGLDGQQVAPPPTADSGGLPSTDAGSTLDAGDAAATSKYAAAVLADQPLAYWRMGAPVAGVIRDETGRGNDLRAMGSSTGYSLINGGALKNDPDPRSLPRREPLEW